MTARFVRLTVWVPLAGLLLLAVPLAAKEPLPWLTDVNAAGHEALSKNRPVLVRVGSASCPWCKELDAEIIKPEVQTALSSWTLVYVDMDNMPEDAARLNASVIPALRILSPRGGLIASHDGYLTAAELLAWLQENSATALSPVDDILLSDQEPTLLEVVQLARQFGARDAELREAAIRRLLPYRKTAASPVVKLLRDGNLASRLAACELLAAWQAPLDQLDPWRPETLSELRLAALDEWLSQIDALPDPGTERQLSAEELAEGRREIESMLKADERGASAARERLARLGRSLLPEVLARLPEAQTDEERERLTTLRYRLVADDALVLSWPGGLERLADTDPTVRHHAAAELAARADINQQPLLLELFSDADPLVREMSLRGIRNVGGEQATSALVTLLNDPEPNVRAAVLKQLAADASDEMLSQVAKYVEQETDADLLVHAIRYLREVQGTTSTTTLLSLLDHDSWQVRAEAAEAVAKLMSKARYGSAPENSAEIYDALLKLLGDPDPFVVSRAVEGLHSIDTDRAVEPLVQAAIAHPTLASNIVDILARGSDMREASVPHFRKFLQHAEPSVRAAAIRGLCKTDPENVKDDLLAAAGDMHTLVRAAAATGLLEILETSRPKAISSSVGIPSVFGFLRAGPDYGALAKWIVSVSSDEPIVTSETTTVTVEAGDETPAVAADPPSADSPPPEAAADEATEELVNQLDVWLAELYTGKHRAAWMSELVEPLRSMLQAEAAEERLAAALTLIPLGDADQALPVLLAAAQEKPALLATAGAALKWLVWERRAEVFHQLFALAASDGQRAEVVQAMNAVPDARAAELYWAALERPAATQTLAQAVQSALLPAYFGEQYYDVSSISTRMRSRAVESVKLQLQHGPPLKRLVAIDVLLRIAADDAAESARQLMNDETVEEAIRADAFQITLAAQTNAQRTTAAIEALAGADEYNRRVAVRFLALGPATLSRLPSTGFTIEVAENESDSYVSAGEPIVPEPPARLAADHVRGLCQHPDPELAAYAGYLLTLFQEPEGLTPLLSYWRATESSSELDRLVYRAIAALNDPQHMAILKEIYLRLDQYSKRDFYWTIRIMTGPEILAFRKQIRDEVGVSNLQ